MSSLNCTHNRMPEAEYRAELREGFLFIAALVVFAVVFAICGNAIYFAHFEPTRDYKPPALYETSGGTYYETPCIC